MNTPRTDRPGLARPLASALALLLALAVSPGARAGDLDPAQASVLAALASHVKQIETNVKLAEDAAGPGTERPAESKARLARTRLAQPEGLVPQVRAELAKLPADHADVAALRGRLDAVAARIVALRTRLDGAPASPSAPPGGTRLDPNQRKDLADATFYVREVEGLAAGLEEIAAEVDAAADKDAFDHRRLRTGAATAEKARQRAGLVKGRLDVLPPGGEGVREVAERLAVATAQLEKAEARVKPVHERVEALIDPARYPAFEADVKRLQGFLHMFSDPVNLFAGDPARAVAVVNESSAAVAEHQRIRAAYAPLLVQRTPEGEKLAGVSRGFEETHAAYVAAEAKARGEMSAAIDAAVDRTLQLADQAVAEGKPAFFLGGIPQQLERIEGLVALQGALDAEAGAASGRRLEKLLAELATRRDALRTSIIGANEPPPDAYAGPDRKALEEAAVAAWRRLEPGANVLGVRIRGTQWSRDVLWRRQNATWYLIDRSRLQAVVLVAHDADLVALRHVDLWRNHLEGDALTATPLAGPKDAPEPQHLLLRSKLP